MVITLSRQAEAGGEEIAQLVSERAGLVLADRARLAQGEGTAVARMAVLDEVAPGRVEAVVAEWRPAVSQQALLRRLVQLLLQLERDDDALIVGRGGAFVLTDPGTLHVRVIAPMPCRIARLVQRERLHPAQAKRLLDASDDTRRRFVSTSFAADIADPIHYDLTLGTAELSAEEAAQTILLAASSKSRRRAIAREATRDLLGRALRYQRHPLLPRVSETIWRRCEGRFPDG